MPLQPIRYNAFPAPRLSNGRTPWWTMLQHTISALPLKSIFSQLERFRITHIWQWSGIQYIRAFQLYVNEMQISRVPFKEPFISVHLGTCDPLRAAPFLFSSHTGGTDFLLQPWILIVRGHKWIKCGDFWLFYLCSSRFPPPRAYLADWASPPVGATRA